MCVMVLTYIKVHQDNVLQIRIKDKHVQPTMAYPR